MIATGNNIDKLFEIEDLKCHYLKDKLVLDVAGLVIERGKITAILGLSGIGKSTILETLGLMNNTLSEDAKVLFYPYKDSNPYDYASLWYKKNEKIRSDIRKEHFSFIFQESNLMHNFSALDNICLTLLLQNETKESAINKVLRHINEMELDQKISDSTMIFNLSGGERQRLSFIRAVAPDFTVLFADEPTGNLDIVNSNRVMNNLSAIIQAKKKSAVIVTHDIKLSLEYANDIIVIDEKYGNLNGTSVTYGYITGRNVYKSAIIEGKKMWHNHLSSDWHESEWLAQEITKIFQRNVNHKVTI